MSNENELQSPERAWRKVQDATQHIARVLGDIDTADADETEEYRKELAEWKKDLRRAMREFKAIIADYQKSWEVRDIEKYLW